MREKLDCWVGSLDFNFLVEIELGLPLSPKKLSFLQGQQQPRKWERVHEAGPSGVRALPRRAEARSVPFFGLPFA